MIYAAIGLLAGNHVGPGHGERLKAIGVNHLARDFDEVARLLGARTRHSPRIK